MIELKNLSSLREFVYIFRELQKISKTLHKIDEGDCNGRSERGEKISNTRRVNLIKRASELAGRLELKIYHQSDPRGVSLYIIETAEEDYTNGIAVF